MPRLRQALLLDLDPPSKREKSIPLPYKPMPAAGGFAGELNALKIELSRYNRERNASPTRVKIRNVAAMLIALTLSGCASFSPSIGDGKCDWKSFPTTDLAKEEILTDCAR